MPQLTTPQALFEHALEDVYYAEKTIEKMLPKLAGEASNRELTRAFETHLKETQQQIENLEEVFSELGKRAKGEACPGIDGIKEEHDKFVSEEDPDKPILDMFLTGAAARTEHYEIAAYTELVGMARTLGESKAAKLLGENLRQEKQALKKVESISKDLLQASKPNGGARRRTGAAGSRSTSARSRSSSSTGRRTSR
jgi:ferritin-like metal-binding protein YciE